MSIDPSASAASHVRDIRAGKNSSEELVQGCLERIAEVNPALNAVVLLRAEEALAEARAADAVLARGQDVGPLHGVPMTIKDSLDTAGVVTTGGTLGRAKFVPGRDATVVARLRAAGAILLGKTNTPEITLAVETDNLVYGRTNNPYDLARSPGGSSGGAAAILAAGAVPFDIGTDTACSIRWPAHCCGIAGIKPTSGRVPRTGHIVPWGLGAVDSLTQIGPMARYVEDLALLLPLVCGCDGVDPFIVDMPLGDPGAVSLKGLRVAVHTDNAVMTPTDSIQACIEDASRALAAAGATVTRSVPEALKRSHRLANALAAGDGRAWAGRILEKAGTKELHPWLAQRISQSERITVSEYTRLLEDVDQFRSEMLGFLSDFDVILCPVAALPAIPHDTYREEFPKGAFSYSQAYNLTGWPAGTVRVGSSPEGLPLGAQVVGRPWREDIVLACLAELERALGGWQKPRLL